MKIIGKIKIIFRTGKYNYENDLSLKVYFKEKGQLFNRSRETRLVNLSWDRVKTYDEFLDIILNYLSDEELLKEMAKDMILKYYNKKEKELETKNKKEQVQELYDMINKKEMKFEMEIK